MIRLLLVLAMTLANTVPATAARPLELIDAFALEYASDPQISPDGKRVVYTRNAMDIMTDRVRGRLWTIDTDGKNHRPLLDDSVKASGARWSRDGRRLAYVVSGKSGSELVVRWAGSGETARIAQLETPVLEVRGSYGGKFTRGLLKNPPKATENALKLSRTLKIHDR